MAKTENSTAHTDGAIFILWLHVVERGQTMRINPYLSSKGDCEAAFRFYERCLYGQLGAIFRYAGSRFGMVVDRFGIPWMVNCEEESEK